MQIKKQKLVISGKLPGRNEAERAARAHWSKGAKFKRENTELVYWMIIAQKITPIKQGTAKIDVTFYEKDKRRDADNVIGGGLKYILDGLVAARIIKNDAREYVDLSVTPVKTDALFPRIEITIEGFCE
jgi:Holliday junction resolvase RusA-like endonuclease